MLSIKIKNTALFPLLVLLSLNLSCLHSLKYSKTYTVQEIFEKLPFSEIPCSEDIPDEGKKIAVRGHIFSGNFPEEKNGFLFYGFYNIKKPGFLNRPFHIAACKIIKNKKKIIRKLKRFLDNPHDLIWADVIVYGTLSSYNQYGSPRCQKGVLINIKDIKVLNVFENPSD